MIYIDDKNIKGMQALLNEIKEYVIVVGSVAEGTDNKASDIDFYVKSKSEELIDKEIESNNYSKDGIEETYLDIIIELLDKYNIDWESEFVSYITTTNTPIQMEFSPVFNIKGKRKSKVVVCGVEIESYVTDIKEVKR